MRNKSNRDVDLAVARGIPTIEAVSLLGINNLKKEGAERVGACPVCGGRNRFAINVRTGLWNCRICAKGGNDALSLVMHANDCSFIEAVGTLSGQSVERLRRPQPAPAQHADNDNFTLELADRAWRQSERLSLAALVLNFGDRSINPSKVPDRGGLRFHPECPWSSKTEPCVIARFTTVMGNEPRGIWRRPLDGSKPKTLGPMSGCVIRLWPDDAVTTGLVVGEGVETTLAAALNIEHEGTMLQPALGNW